MSRSLARFGHTQRPQLPPHIKPRPGLLLTPVMGQDDRVGIVLAHAAKQKREAILVDHDRVEQGRIPPPVKLFEIRVICVTVLHCRTLPS